MDNKTQQKHIITIQDRNKVAITGVIDVYSFDETQVDLETIQGMLLIQGESLHITRLTLDKGDLNLEGLIYNIIYHEDQIGKPGSSFLSKLFK